MAVFLFSLLSFTIFFPNPSIAADPPAANTAGGSTTNASGSDANTSGSPAANTPGSGTVANQNPQTANTADDCGTTDIACNLKAGILRALSFIMLWLSTLALRLLMFVLQFLITIASYNSFLKSAAVNYGWVLVRDLTNMVFVVALLLIAFGTILGLEKYEWKQMMFKLISAAVLVNFSRTICGLIIDAAQVVMITFVNGIASTIGGKFIQAFSLNSVRSFAADASADSGAAVNNLVSINTEGVFIASIAALFVSVTILITTAILLGMLVARVIALWVLIVLSPIAFVLSVLPQTKSYASQWWSEFGKNVITGPVLIFFLWLTLVTVGQGNINNEINSSVSSIQYDEATASGNIGITSNMSSGIAAVLKWDYLVNFCIAIGMLLAGIKVTQQLGGVGASALGKAVDWGKKAAYYASGAAAARWGARQAVAGAKAGAMAAGGYAVEPFKLFGKNAVNTAKLWYGNRFKEANLEKAKALASQAYDKENGQFKEPSGLKRLLARARLAADPRFREAQRKRLAASEAAVEAQKERFEKHTLEVGQAPEAVLKAREAGRLRHRDEEGAILRQRGELDENDRQEAIYQINRDKQNLRGEISQLEETRDATLAAGGSVVSIDADIRARRAQIEAGNRVLGEELGVKSSEMTAYERDAERRMKAEGAKGKYEYRKKEQEAAKKMRYDEATGRYVSSDEGRGRAAAISRAEAVSKQVNEAISGQDQAALLKAVQQNLGTAEGRRRQSEIMETKAKAEYESRQMDKEKELRVAEEKDKILVGQGQRPQYAAQVKAAHVKEEEDRTSALNHREITSRAKFFAKDLKDLVDAGATDTADYKNKSRYAMGTLTASLKRGTETGLEAVQNAAAVAGFDETIKAGDHTGMQRMVLSALSGKKVIRGHEQATFDELKNTHGEDDFNTMMRSLDEALKKGGQEYAPLLTGLTDDHTVDDRTGKVTFKLQIDPGTAKISRDYWRGSVSPAKVLSFQAIVGSEATKDAAGNVTGYRVASHEGDIDRDAQENFVAIFKGVTKGTKIDSRLADEWETMEARVKQKLLDALKAKHPDAAGIFEKKIKK